MRHINDVDNTPLTSEEAKRLIKGITDPKARMLITLGIFMGCRVNEMASLRTDKIDYNRNIITVWDDKHNQYRGSKKAGTRVKIAEGRWRAIKIPQEVMRKLAKYQKRHLRTGTYLWVDDYTAHSYKILERAIQKWSKLILGRQISWHCLRHTMMTLSREAGKSLEFVISQTGDTPAMILKVYSKITPSRLEEEAEKPIL
jgi:integrase